MNRRYPPSYYRALNSLATDAQWSYVQRLMNEAFAHHYHDVPNIDAHHRPQQYLKTEASAHIERLLAAKAKGWKV